MSRGRLQGMALVLAQSQALANGHGACARSVPVRGHAAVLRPHRCCHVPIDDRTHRQRRPGSHPGDWRHVCAGPAPAQPHGTHTHTWFYTKDTMLQPNVVGYKPGLFTRMLHPDVAVYMHKGEHAYMHTCIHVY
eukprot:206326-Chlamydomonas_euryale.AAC.1